MTCAHCTAPATHHYTSDGGEYVRYCCGCLPGAQL